MADRIDPNERLNRSNLPLGGERDEATLILSQVYRDAIEHVPVATSITDIYANILYINPAFEKLTGYSANDLTGLNESILSDNATPDHIYQDMWTTISAGEVWNGNLVNRRKDGSSYVAKLTVVPVFDDDGKIIHYIGMHQDVTDLHSLERKVKNQDALMTSVIESAPVIIVLVDTSGRVAFSNPAYTHLKREAGGHDISKHFVAAFEDSLGQNLETMCAKGFEFAAVEVSLDVKGRDPLWFACSATKVEEKDMTAVGYFEKDRQSGLLLIANDITHQRKRYEQARLNAVRALMIEQQMVQGMREVMSGAIFQLQGPLNVMGAAASMMERQGNNQNGLHEPIKQVISAGETAIDRLRSAIPNPTDEAVTAVNINEITREVLDLSIEALLKEGIEVQWQPESTLQTVPGRANALRSLIKYLVDNAIFSIKDGANSREILINTRTSDAGDVVLEITDGGFGFDQDILIKAFEPFFTAWKKTRSRPGMGLSLARQIILDQGGDMKIVNVLSGGGKVEVIFASTSFDGGAEYEH